MDGTMIFATLITCCAFGYVTGHMAEKQGRSFSTWFIGGFLCFIIAFFYLLLSKPSDEAMIASGKYRKCPQCAEVIKADAKVCRYCGNKLPVIETNESSEQSWSIQSKTVKKSNAGNPEAAVLSFVFVILFIFIIVKLIG